MQSHIFAVVGFNAARMLLVPYQAAAEKKTRNLAMHQPSRTPTEATNVWEAKIIVKEMYTLLQLSVVRQR